MGFRKNIIFCSKQYNFDTNTVGLLHSCKTAVLCFVIYIYLNVYCFKICTTLKEVNDTALEKS